MGLYSEAQDDLQLYLVSPLPISDAETVRELIARIEGFLRA